MKREKKRIKTHTQLKSVIKGINKGGIKRKLVVKWTSK